MDDMIQDALGKGFISFEQTWMTRAIEAHNPRLTVYLANSAPILRAFPDIANQHRPVNYEALGPAGLHLIAPIDFEVS